MVIAALLGCGPATLVQLDGDGIDQSNGSALVTCDRSPYNCKLPDDPNFKQPDGDEDRNRIFNPATQSYQWPIAPGTPLLDGLANARGKVVGTGGAGPSVKINYGMRRAFGADPYVYSWSSPLDTGGSASGWVKEANLVGGVISRMPTLAGLNPGQGDLDTPWVITGGNLAAVEGLKVSKGWSGPARNATDYLVRSGVVVNLLYNLPLMGGVSLDSFPLGTPFRQARGVAAIPIALYEPGSESESHKGPMLFIYGHVGERYGWIAKAALTDSSVVAPGSPPTSNGGGAGSSTGGGSTTTPAPPPPPPAVACSANCCDGAGLNASFSSSSTCLDSAQVSCAALGYVKNAQFGGSSIYSRATSCYAKCANRTVYHEVPDVTSDCAGRARAYCAEPGKGRGAFQDAKWSQCP